MRATDRRPWADFPYGLVSLSDMLRFYAHRFHAAVHMIAAIQREIRDETGNYIPDKLCEQLGKQFDTLGEIFEEMNLLMSKKSIDNLRDMLKNRPTRVESSFKTLLSHAYRTINDELSLTLLFSVKPENAKFYDPPSPLFGQGVADKFPSAQNEIDEAGKCFALSRYTACVFHLMRALEIGIDGTRKCLGIPDPIKDADRNWGAILRRLREELTRRNQAVPVQWAAEPDKDFFEDIYVSLDAVRNVWRNATMHVERTYTEEQAEHIFVAVRGLMKKLADRLDEQGWPLA